MFFNDIYSWSSFKLKRTRALYYLLYFLFSTIIPCIIIGFKYKIFEKHTGYGFTGFGLIMAVCVVTIGIKKMLDVINDMPDIDIKDQRKKFTMQMIVALMIPATAAFTLWMLDKKWDTAASVIRWCLASWCIAIAINYMFCKSLDVANMIQKEAKKKIAVDKAAEALRK